MKRFSLLALCAALLWTGSAFGQGVLVVINPPHPVPLPRPIPRPEPRPAPPMSYKITELDYHARVKDQVAQVQTSQTFENTGSAQMEVSFVFPVPYDGAIDRMTFMVDGKEYDAKLLPAKEARKVYEDYVRRCQDPALLEWIGHGMFKTSVFPVPPGAERKVTLRYSQLLRKQGQLTDFIVPLATAKYTSSPVEKLSIRVAIESSGDLKNVYSPSHDVDIERPGDKHATVKYEAKNVVPTSDFRLMFDAKDGKLGASLVSYRPDDDDEGYFLLLASPDIKARDDERPKKTVIFVVDRSGSMSGKKIEQARESLKFVLNNLRDGDTFNIVAYDSSVESFRPELQKYDDETRQAALGFIEGLYAGGSTNIDGALTTALGMIPDDDRPSFVLFLTDGLPTTGETNESKIAENAKQHNKHHARMINFGVGYDVNSRLLDRLSRENYGQSEYVRPDEDIEAHVARVQGRFTAPVMTDVKVTVDVEGSKSESGKPTSRIYPKQVYDLFAGDQLVLVGRYKQHGDAKVTIEGNVAGRKQKFDFPGKLVKESSDQSLAFVEKLWAMRRIGEIIDELDLKGKNDELIKELVSLSTEHGIVTEYTSFLADETSTVRELASAELRFERARDRIERLSEASGISGFAQRTEKQSLQQAARAPRAATPAFDAYGTAPAGPSAGPASTPALGASGQSGGLGGLRLSNVYRDAEDKVILAKGIQNAGNETLFKCGNLWIANNARSLDPEKDADKIQRIKRFSDQYFALVRENTPAENAILAAQQPGEEILCVFRGQAYRIE